MTDRAGERHAPCRPLCWFAALRWFGARRRPVQYEFRFQGRIRAADMARASDAILSAVPDESAWKVLFPDIALMKQRIPILQAHRLNIFSQPPPWPLGSPLPATGVAEAARCAGNVDTIEPVTGAPDAFQLKGWAWDRAANQPIERLVVVSGAQRVVGYGSSGWPRPDAARALAGANNVWIGWTAFGRAPAGRFAVHGLLRDGSLCPIGEKAVP